MMQAPAPPLVLASQSTARAALLAAAGLQFEAWPARVDEAAVKQACRAEGADAAGTALTLAGLKARRIRNPDALVPEALVIGADQLLVCNEAWFDKPADRDGARTQLQALRGQTHRLVTAVVCLRGGQEVWRYVAEPRLRMRGFSDAFLEAYLAAEGDAILACVGAYRLEGLGVHLFDEVQGEHAAILGLPMLPLLGFLRQHGVVAS